MAKNGNNIHNSPSSDRCNWYGLSKIRNEGVLDYKFISQSDTILDIHHGGGILKEAWVEIRIYARTGSQLVRRQRLLVRIRRQ